MAQGSNLLDLLADDEEEEDDDEEPQALSDLQALLRGSAQADAGARSTGTLSQASGSQPPQKTSGTEQNASGQSSTAFPVQLLLEWCRRHLSAGELTQVHATVRDMKTKIAQGTKSPKEVYTSILGLIGNERMKLVRGYIMNELQRRNAQDRGSSQSREQTPAPSGGPHQVPVRAHPGPLAGPQQLQRQLAGSASHGGSIMQSLVYNAEQARHPPSGQAGSEQPAVMLAGSSAGGPQQSADRQSTSSHLGPAGVPASQVPAPAAAKAPVEGAGLPPAGPKKAKRDKEDVEEENDVLKDSGINLEEEQSALLGTLERGGNAASQPSSSLLSEPSFLNSTPLGIKVLDIAKRHGLDAVDPSAGQLLSRATDAHLGALIARVFAAARQRTDTERTRPGMALSSNLRRRLHEYNMQQRREQEELERPAQEPAPQAAAAGTKRRQEDDPAKRADKASRRETEKQQVTAANAAAAAAFGGKAQKWGAWSVDAAKKPAAKAGKPDGAAAKDAPASAPPARQEEGPREAARAAALPPSRVKAEMLSAKLVDLLSVLERDPLYEKSTLLYKLYGQLPE